MSATVTLTPTGAVITGDLDPVTFAAQAQALQRDTSSRTWALGDLVNAIGWGDKREACAQAGIDYKTARNAASVAAKFEMSRRRDNLSFAHHAEVAAMPAAQVDALLERAAAAQWSVRQLRDVRKGEDPAAADRAAERAEAALARAVEKISEAIRTDDGSLRERLLGMLGHDEDQQLDPDLELACREAGLADSDRDLILLGFAMSMQSGGRWDRFPTRRHAAAWLLYSGAWRNAGGPSLQFKASKLRRDNPAAWAHRDQALHRGADGSWRIDLARIGTDAPTQPETAVRRRDADDGLHHHGHHAH
jgi:hypothetical protein